jgi:hypothetical protein
MSPRSRFALSWNWGYPSRGIGVIRILQEMWTKVKTLYVLKEGGRCKNGEMTIGLLVIERGGAHNIAKMDLT